MNLDNDLIILILALIFLYVISKFIPSIIKYVKSIKIKNQYQKANIKDIDRMSGLDFELYLSILFKKLGYRTIVTNGSHDFGADVILKKNNHKIVLQAKRYGYKKNVSISAIQEVFSAQQYHNADECWVITNSYFTKSAKKLASACDVKLKDRQDLVKWIIKINPDTKPNDVKRNNVEKRLCPACNNKLIIRKSKNGNEFIGCTNFPVCKHTETL
jgi:restriction system protein